MIATTGFFDGVHLGHRAVLQRVVDLAEQQGDESAVITFWPHPRVILHRDAERVRLLNSLDEKKERIHRLGIKHVWVLPFTKELSLYTPEQFFETFLQKEYRVTALVVGHDHRLGNNADAGYEQMKEIGAGLGIGVACVNVVACSHETNITGSAVSSTKIRAALEDGNVALANRFLDYCYRLEGVVVEGQHVGREMGFPTANMQLYEPLKQLPKNGVYATRVLLNGATYKGMTNIGHRPTVQPDDPSRTIETNIFDFADDIYGQALTIEFTARVRDEQRFSSIDALKAQLQKDKERIAQL